MLSRRYHRMAQAHACVPATLPAMGDAGLILSSCLQPGPVLPVVDIWEESLSISISPSPSLWNKWRWERERERERWAISPSSPRLGTLSTAPRIAVLVPIHTDESFSFLGKEAECSSWSIMKVFFRPLGTLCCVYLLEYAKKKNKTGWILWASLGLLPVGATHSHQHSASSSLNIYSHWVVLDDWCLLLICFSSENT